MRFILLGGEGRSELNGLDFFSFEHWRRDLDGDSRLWFLGGVGEKLRYLNYGCDAGFWKWMSEERKRDFWGGRNPLKQLLRLYCKRGYATSDLFFTCAYSRAAVFILFSRPLSCVSKANSIHSRVSKYIIHMREK